MSVVPVAAAATLRINEVFFSVQGESSRVGLPTVFVRLTGCPLRCRWCDTEYAFHEGRSRELADILAEVRSHPARHVCITGGEPLAQPAVRTLMTLLADAGCAVSIETSGAQDISGIDPRVQVVMDLKCPDSQECSRNLWSNLAHLRTRDEVKFVLASRGDYEWMREVLARERLPARCGVLASPVWGELDPAMLAGWILEDGLDVRLQVQLHKVLWQDARGK
ncbi:MAG: 7-carboxy-7-deazaguanine synthase QueE [Rhodocyclaceae bacterium]|nr:7-carboxy-7-deazaguanine synthase QueE [Rhodocyclaceae bacterium]